MQKPSTNKKSQRFFKRNTAKASKATTKKTTRTSPVILSEAKDLPRMWDSNELRDSSPAYGRGQNDKKTPRPIPVSEINLKIQRGRLLKIGHASKVLSVSIDTLRRWEKAGKIEVVRTPGGTRLYSVSALQKINPVSVADFQTKNLTTEELLKKAENQTIDGGKWKIGVEDRSWKIESPSSIIHPQNTTLHPLSPIVNKVLLGTAVLSALILFFTSLITASYLFQPQPTQKFFQNNIASGLFLPFHRLAQTFVSAVDPKKAKELGFAEPEPPPLSDKDLLANNPNVLAVTASSRFLEVNSDTQINGSLFVRDSINGLALEATPSAGTMILVSGPTSLTVTKTAKLDQDVSTGASPSFTSLKLTDTKDQLVLGSNGTLTWTPTASRTVTVPDATGTIVLDTSSQTLTNKTISGSSNTITNIANSSLSNSKITVTAGTNLTGGGDINLGSSATLSLKDSISLIGTLGVSGATTLSSTLAVTGATTLSSTLAVTGATTLSSSLRVSGNVGIGFTGSSTVTAPDLGLAVAGSVGIGTSSPAYKLDVAGQVNASTGLCIAGDCKSSWTGVGGYTASNGITLSSQDFQLGGNLTRATGIDVNSQNFGFLGGNVGIGNSNPDYALKVTGTGYFSGFLGVGSSMSVSGNVGIGASLNVTSAGIFGSLGASSLSVSGASTLSTLTTSGNTGIGGSASVTGLTYALGGLRVNGFSDLTGNVGIGGTATVSSLLNANGILNSNGSATAPAYSFSNLTNAGLWTNGDGLLLTTGGSNTSGITVTGAGNVGVGTTSPTARLQVGTTSDTTAAGGITFGGDVNLYRVNANRLQTDDDLWFGGTLSSTGSFYLATSDVTNARIYNTGGMAWGTSGWADPGANNISVNGNVGIGRAFAAGATIAPLDVRNTNTGTTLNAYIGSSAGQFGILDNGNVGIGLSNPGTTLAVRGNLNVGYTGAVSDTLGLSVRGNVGIGTTSPAGALHVVGQCVTGDTKLRRRKKKKNGDWSDEYEDVEIKDIQEGDEILSLNEKTGEFEPHAVKGLMDMGIHKIYQLITSSGKSIRTTGNHPYLIRPTRTPSIIGGVFEVDQSPKLEQLNKDSFIALANKNTHFIIKISRKYKKQLYQQYQDKNKQRFFAPDIFARAINILLSLDKIQPFELKIDNEYTGYEARIREIITLANPSLLISYRSMGHSAVSFAHWAAYRVFKGEYATDLELAEGSKEAKEKDRGTQRVGLGIVAPVPLNRIRNARDLTSQDYHKLEDLSNTKWLKVYEIKTGMEVATVDGWEKVVSIKEFERERVFDIEVEGTHNFVGNDIVAHNTFITGNVGIGATSTAYNLDVWGTGRFSSALTVGGNLGIGASVNVSSAGIFGSLRSNGFSDLTGNVGVGGTANFSSLVVSSSNIIPSANDTYDLGSDALRWNNVYVGPSTVHIGTSTSDEYTIAYDTTNNRLGFNVNGSGSAEIVMDSSGNVGIGTTAPGASLSVAGNSTIGFGGATSIAGPANGLGVSGNLGIGTTTANSNLSVVGNAHIGSARQGISAPTDGLFVDGNVGIGATTSTNKLDVWGNARVAGTGTFDSTLTALNGLFGYSGVTAPTSGLAISGNVGVGTTSPLGQLHVVGQCVVGETKLKRRRRKKKNGKWIDEWEEVEIKDIKEGDQVLSLNEKTGEFEPHEVRGLLDMGKQEVFELITQSKLKIKTTAEHPYLVLQTPPLKSQFSTTFEADASNRVEDRGKDTIVAIANREKAFAVSLTKQEKQKLYKKYYSEGKPQRFGPEVFTRLIINLVVKNNIKVTKLVVDREYSTDYDKLIAEGLEKSLPGITVYIRSVGHNSPADRAAYFAHKNKEVQARSNLYGFRAAELHHHEWLHGSNSPLYLLTKENCTTEWVKVKYLRPGMTIATTLGWQKISNIVPRGKQQTFDIEVEGTHNFVGNNIVAHNTYINGSLGIGAYSGLTVPTNGLAISGNVGIGITTANSALSVAGGAHIGSIRQGISAPTDGLFVDGNVGIGATTSSNKLDVWGNARITAGLTLDGLSSSAATALCINSSNQVVQCSGSSALTGTGVSGGVTYWNGTSSLSNSVANFYWDSSNNRLGIGTSTPYGQLQVGSGVTPGLFVNSGNVGIGTTNPTQILQVGDPNVGTGFVGIHIVNSSGGVYLGTNDNKTVFDAGRNGTYDLTLDSAGNVGIGATTVNSTLAVVGSAHIGSARQGISAPTDGLFVDGNVGIGATSTAYNLDVWGTGRFSSALTVGGNIGVGASLNVSSAGIFGSLGTSTLSVSGNTTLSALTTSGNTGIGASASITGLTYALGGLRVNGFSDLTGNVGIGASASITSYLSAGSVSSIGPICLGGDCRTAWSQVGSTYTGSNGITLSGTDFQLGGNLTRATGIDVAGQNFGFLGNVGIGNSTPDYALKVTGTGYFSGFVGIGSSLSVSGNVGIGGTATISSLLNARGILNSNGSATAPAYSFTNLTNAGLWTNGDGLLLTTGGSNTSGITVTGAGNIGIGTTNPIGLLSVGATNNATDFNGVATAKRAVIAYSSSNTTVANDIGLVIRNEDTTANNTVGLHFSGYSGGNSNNMIGASIIGIMGARTTGQYHSGQLAFLTTAGANVAPAEVMRINGSGNVGIGDISPDSPLEVLNTSAQLRLSYADGTDSTLGVDTNGDLTITGTGDEIFLQGQLGIGAANPTSTFGYDLYVADTTATDIFVDGTTNGSTANLTLQARDSTPGVTNTVLSHAGTNAARGRFTIDNSASSGIEFTISPAGYVGVGMTAPDRQLHVASTIDITPTNAGLMGVGGTQLDISGATTNAAKKLVLGIDTTDNYGIIQTGNTDGTNYALALNPAGGNVGIGTTSPLGRLDITDTSNTAASLLLTNNTATTIGNGANTLGVLDLQSTSLTTGNFLNIELNGLTSGKGLNLTSTSTGLTSGYLAYFNWNPGSTTTATGDLVNIGIGSSGNIGNLLNITDDSSSIFSVSETSFITSLPSSFTSAGDVAVAYDLNFTNPTASYIKSSAPLYIVAGETFNSSDLTLQTYNSGSIILDTGLNGNVGIGVSGVQNFTFAPTGNLGIGTSLTSPGAQLTVGKNALIGFSGSQSAPATGLAVSGNVGIGITTANSLLSVAGGAHIGSVRQGISAPTDGLFVDGNVGIGATSTAYNLDVWGTGRISSALTVGGNIGIGGSASVTGLTYALGGLRVNGFSDLTGNVGIGGTATLSSALCLGGECKSSWSGSGNYTASNGLTLSGVDFQLGGFLTRATGIDIAGQNFGFLGGNVGIGTTAPSFGTRLFVQGSGTSTGINFQTVGSNLTQGLTVLDNGNVGIGTTGPGAKLHVVSTLLLGSTGATHGYVNTDDNLFINIDANNDSTGNAFIVAKDRTGEAGGTELFRVQENGNVGIGFTSPDRLLQIGSDINITGSAASILGANGAQFSITGSTANTTAKKLTLGVDTTDNYGVIQAGNTDGTAYNLVLQPGGGNVGIGTTSPLAALDIRNAISVGTDDTTEGQITFQTTGTETAPTIAASAGNLQLTTSTGWIVLTPDNGIQVTGNGTNIWWQANNGNATFDLYKSSATTGLTITNTANASDRADLYVAKGNVGIGTTTANSTLSVAGGAHIGSIRQGIAAPADGLFVDGNVGIGATTSSNKLDVWGNARIAGTGIIDSTLTALNGLIGYSGVTAPTSGLAVSGNVGIGTTSPVAPLHIWGNNTNSAFFLNGNVGIGTTTPTYALDITGNSALWQSVYGTDDGLVGYWPFSEGTGSKAYDRGPSGNDGTLTGAGGLPVWTTGKYGNALDFDGTDDYVLSANSETDLTTFTAELWINPDSASPGTTQTILSHGSSPTDNGWTLEMPSGQNKLRLTFNGVGNYDSNTGILAAGVWQHAVVTLTGTTATFYLNGRQVGTATTGSMGAATHKYSIGATPGGTNFFSGLIDDVRVYNRVLSADEIKAHYLRGDTPGKTIAIETSTAAGNLFGLRGLVTDTGIVTTGTDTTYGSRIDLTRTGATGGTINSYGQYIALTADNAGAGTSNSWGLYVNTSGSTADNNYSAYFSGNVGIGTTSPGSALTVIGNVGIGTSAAGASLQVNGGGLFGWGTASVAAPANGLGIKGNVGIGTTSPSAPLEVRGSGTGATIAKFTDENNTGCTLATGGTITCSSDINLKKNITEIDYGLDSLMSLHPVTYNWKSEADGTIQSLGFIAQEIEQVIPKLVTTDPSSGLKELNTIGLIPVITKSIQQLNDKIAAISINDEGELVVPKLKTGSIVLDPSIASASAQVTADANNNASLDMSDKLASLENRIAALESTSKEATTSGENTSVGTELTPEVKLTPPDILLATGSAQLASLTVHSEATVSGKLTAYDLDVQNGLKALGKTTLADTTIAGTLTVDGTLSIENGSEINVIGAGSSPDGGPQGLLGGGTGILYLQKSSLAQGLDIFDGKVTIDKTGSLIAQKVSAPEVVTNKLTISNTSISLSTGTPIASDSAALGTQVEPTIGSSSLPQGTLELAVFTNQADDKSKIFVTPRSSTLGQSLYIKEVVENSGFVVGVDRPIPNDVNFDWWIVGTN